MSALDANAEGTLLALIAYPEDAQRACYESGTGTWEGFLMACELLCIRGYASQLDLNRFALTAAGRQAGLALLAAERAADEAGTLTRREANALWGDVAHAHIGSPGHALWERLEDLSLGDDDRPLTREEARAAISCSAAQGCLGLPLQAKAAAKLEALHPGVCDEALGHDGR